MKNYLNKLLLISILMMSSIGVSKIYAQSHELTPSHVFSNDSEIIDEAFLHGYTHNIVYEDVNGRKVPTLTIQCTNSGIHVSDDQLSSGRTDFSIWTRDLYWGFLGWAQAGDDKVIEMMKTSLELLILAKDRNQSLGQSEMWPLNDKRFYIPQAYTSGLKPAIGFYPWCSESQVDFLLLAYNYWEQSGDLTFIESIWDDIVYVTETIELMDTDGNSLPDALHGSYDYMWITIDSEEPLMCAKTSLAYKSVAQLAKLQGKNEYANHLAKLAVKVKETMNKSIDEGGLWKSEGEKDGYYVQMRNITPGEEKIEDMFIPYDNLVPMWCGMTNSSQDEAIFTKLDTDFDKYYNLKYGPMYCATAGHNDESVMDCSSVTWLAFLDVYLRGVKGHEENRATIFEMLMEHSKDAGGTVFPEGAGVYGYLTGGAGRSWDNGSFFHMLISGVYGLEKTKDGISISSPQKIDNVALTELKNVCWREAVYHFQWKGEGKKIKKVLVNGKKLKPKSGNYKLTDTSGEHKILIILERK